MDETSKKLVMHVQSAQHRILLKNGTIVNHDGCKVADVYIEDSIIKQVGNHLIIPGGTRIIDVLGKYIIPGGIDPNVHLQSPVKTEGTEAPNGTRTIDDFYSGTKAAVAGGTTTVIDLVKPEIGESLIKAFDKWQGWAEEKACCDFSFKIKLPEEKLTPAMIDEMRELTVDNYAVNCFQASMEQLHDEELIEFFDTCSSLGCVAQVVYENGELVKRNTRKILDQGVTGPEGFPLAHSEEVEEEAVLRACTLANQMNCPLYLPHISSKSSVDIIKAKKKKDQVIFGEANPASLTLDGKGYLVKDWKKAAALVMNPPLRRDQSEALNDALAEEGSLDLSGSNHATFNSNQKALGINDFTKIPVGANGVQERMSIIWEQGVQSGKMTPERFVAVTSAAAAKIFGLYPDKGYIDVGSQADIVVWDPKAITTISTKNQISKSDLNIYEGLSVHGKAEYVILRGRVVVDEGDLKAVQGHGRFIPLSPYPAHVYEKIKSKEVFKFTPVIREEQDFQVNGGDIPPPAAAKSLQPEKAPSQHISQFDLKSHPMDPEPETALENNNLTRTKHRSSIRIKNPPGGRSSGSFW